MTIDELAIEKRRAYNREYYAKNREKIQEQRKSSYNPAKKREYNKRYWQKKAEKEV